MCSYLQGRDVLEGQKLREEALDALGLPVKPEEVKAHLASLDDADTQQWLIKARGGL